MTEVFCNTCGKGFKNPGSLASHRYKIHKTVKYKSYRNHKECNDNVKYEMSVSESRDLDKIEDGLAKLRNEVAIEIYPKLGGIVFCAVTCFVTWL